MELNKTPQVSVVISTYNSQATIAECLKSINGQNYPKERIEIIVVDKNSSDKTVAIAKGFTGKVFSKGPERSSQRNYGAQKAEGEYILYLDSDMSLSESVISECVEKCQRQGLVGLYVPERIKEKGLWPKVRDFERSFYNSTCIDCVRFVRRNKFLEIGGFDENLTGPEDWDFDRRLKSEGKTEMVDSLLYHNGGRFTFKGYLRKKQYYFRGLDKYREKWGKSDPLVKKQLGFSYRFWGAFTEKGKWKKLLRHPVLSVEMFFLKVSIGIVYLLFKLRNL